MATEVQIRQDCKHCEGTGIRYNPIWNEFWEQPKASDLTPEEAERWFSERGEMRETTLIGRTTWLFPEEEIECWDCEGQGQVARWVPIDEVRKLLAPAEALLTSG